MAATSPTSMSMLSETVEKKRHYAELLAGLDDSLPALAEQVDGLADRMLPGLCPGDQLDWLDVLAGEADARRRDVDSLAAAGDELIAVLVELDCKDTPKAREIAAEVNHARSGLADIDATINTKRTALEGALSRLMAANADLAAALAWIEGAESRAAGIIGRGPSLNPEVLKEQIAENRSFAADVTAYAPNVVVVVERCASVWIESRVTELQDRHRALTERLDQHDRRLDDVLRRLNAVADGIAALDHWIGRTVGSIGRRSADLEQLVSARQSRKKEMDAVTAIARELTSDEATVDRHILRDAVSDLRARWRELTQLLANAISSLATSELNELTKFVQTADTRLHLIQPVGIDPEEIVKLLQSHKSFHEELGTKRDTIDRMSARCRRMMLESPSEEEPSYDVDVLLSAVRDQVEALCRLSDKRLRTLGELEPLVIHLGQMHLELRAWLCDVSADVNALDWAAGGTGTTPDGEDRAEQLRIRQSNLKTTAQLINDHQGVNELLATGQELVALCGDSFDPSPAMKHIHEVVGRCETLKLTVKHRLADLEVMFKRIVNDATENLSMLLETARSLCDKVSYADEDSSLTPAVIRQQIVENNDVMADLDRLTGAIAEIEEVASQLQHQSEEDSDMLIGLNDVAAMRDTAMEQSRQRASRLKEALEIAERFQGDVNEILAEMNRIQNLAVRSHEIPVTSADIVRQQLKDLQMMLSEMKAVKGRILDCARESEKFASVDGVNEARKYVGELEDMFEDVDEGLKRRIAELESDLEKADSYGKFYEAVMTWLPRAEEKLQSMSLIAANARSVRIQIEEFKVFKVQMCKWQSDVHSLNQYVAELKRSSSSATTVSALATCALAVNERWSKLMIEANEREAELRGALIELGEVEHAVEDVMGLLQQVESDLQQYGDVYGDPRHIEVHLRKIQILLKELSGQQGIIHKLDDTIDTLVRRSGRTSAPLADRQQEMLSMFIDVQASARERRDELLDRLNEVKSFVSSADDLMKWLDDFRRNLQWCTPLGALPETARAQLSKLMDGYRELESKEMEVMAMTLNGEDMFVRCHDHEARLLRRKLVQLKATLNDTKAKADKIKIKMEEHVGSVERFHGTLSAQTEWLSTAEKRLRALKKPSKIYDGIQAQIRGLKALKADIERHSAEMKGVDQTGTYLKYFGSKQDTVYVRNRLSSVRLRWKRLLRRVDETGRTLDKALGDAKRFYDMWKSLCEWLESSEETLQKFYISGGVRTKQDLDELRRFELEMSSKQPIFCSVRRLGAALCDRCSKNDDAEKGQLSEMIGNMVTKWNKLRLLATQRLDKAFSDSVPMTSIHMTEAVESMFTWLATAESYLSESRPVLGDTDTVNMLMQQHQNLQQELLRRMELMQRLQEMTEQPENFGARLDQLSTVFEKVRQLTDCRLNRLHEALKLADDFNDSLEAINEWLPLAEAELKFRSLPENEDGLMRWIENHEKFDEELRAQEPDVDRMTYVGEEILMACHRSADRFVRYHMTTMQSRWQQALRRSKLRTTRLHEALHDLRHGAVRYEDIESWLAQMHVLLTSRDGLGIPQDEKAILGQLAEHAKLHQELIARALDIEQRTCLAGSISAFNHQTHASTLPAGSSMHGRTTPPASTMVQSWTPGGSLPRSRTPSNSMSQSQTLPSARSRTPPVGSSHGRSQTPPVTIARSRTPPVSGASARSRTPPATGSNRSRTPPATSVSRSRTPPGDTQQTRVRVPSGSPRRRVLPSVPTSDDQTPVTERRGSTAYRDRYRLLLELSSARKKQLEDNLERVRERKVHESFDCGDWQRRCSEWLRSHQLRAVDLFRLQDRTGSGALSRKQFVDALVTSRFPSSYAELNAVYDAYDVTLSGHIGYRDLVKHLDKQSVVARLCGEPVASASAYKLIHEEIRQQQRRCICPSKFLVQKVDDGKYKFGDRGKLCLVRFVNSSVTVRVGGGWKTLEEFFDSNDPCRLKYRPMRSGQMTPPDVVPRNCDDLQASRPVWNPALLSTNINHSPSLKSHLPSQSFTSSITKTRNHSFCSPRWGAPNDHSPPSAYPPPVGAARPTNPEGSISHFIAPRQAGAQPDVRPTATWPRTPKPQKPVSSSPGSPSSTRRNVRAAGSGDSSASNGRDKDACRPSFYILKR